MLPVENIMQKLKMKDKALAERLGCHQSTIARWRYPREKNGRNGNIPYQYHQRIKDIAQEIGVVLTADDFMPAKDA